MAQQLSGAVEAATARHWYALSTKAGCECVAHIPQGLTEMNPEATVTSVDGVVVRTTSHRGESMLTGLRNVVGGSAALPFERLFCGRPSGTVHRIPHGEGGRERGRPHAPCCSPWDNTRPSKQRRGSSSPRESLFAYLDDIFTVTSPDQVGPDELFRVASPRVHHDSWKQNKGRRFWGRRWDTRTSWRVIVGPHTDGSR